MSDKWKVLMNNMKLFRTAPYMWWMSLAVSSRGRGCRSRWVPSPWTYSRGHTHPNSQKGPLTSDTPQKGHGTRDTHPLPCEQIDKHLWKHYLPATTVAGGNYSLLSKYLGIRKSLYLVINLYAQTKFLYLKI